MNKMLLKVLFLCVLSTITFCPCSNLPFAPENVKIYGGKTAKPGQFPFMVSIVNNNHYHLCGGSIFNEQWIVTAAHCLVDWSPGDYYILAGTTSLSSGGTLYKVNNAIMHQGFNTDYNVSTYTDDVGLVKIEGTFNFSDLVQVIEIGEVAANDSTVAMGWGLINATTPSYDLLYFEPRALSDEECTEMSEGGEYVFDRVPGEVCAVASEGFGVCLADSGGPLIANGALVGVVSYGVSPCARGYPDVYTRVAYYVDWISEHIANN